MTALLDGNVLVSLCSAEHVHHEAAVAWFVRARGRFATTPITQGTVVRCLLRAGAPVADALEVLAGVTEHERHEFWADDVPLDSEMLAHVIGHRQVTDAYLAALARRRGGRVATFDRGLAALHKDVAELIDV